MLQIKLVVIYRDQDARQNQQLLATMPMWILLFLTLGASWTPMAFSEDLAMSQLKTISYNDYLAVRSKPDTILLFAPEIENLFAVVPEDKIPTSPGITQKMLDQALSEIIPSKDTRVILYCHVNFDPQTRRMPARRLVGISLLANGYSNVYELSDLWKDNALSSSEIKKIADQEIFPYTKKLPDSIIKTLHRAYNSTPPSSTK